MLWLPKKNKSPLDISHLSPLVLVKDSSLLGPSPVQKNSEPGTRSHYLVPRAWIKSENCPKMKVVYVKECCVLMYGRWRKIVPGQFHISVPHLSLQTGTSFVHFRLGYPYVWSGTRFPDSGLLL